MDLGTMGKVVILLRMKMKDVTKRTDGCDASYGLHRSGTSASGSVAQGKGVERYFLNSVYLSGFLFAALTFAHRARCAAAILLRALADMDRFLGDLTSFDFPLSVFTFAHRALWAAAILALPAADITPLRVVPFAYAAPKAMSAAPTDFISLLNRSRSVFNNRTTPPRFVIEFPRGDCSRVTMRLSFLTPISPV